jgi:predicted Rossmann fold nucleotide-binding protein DprA/Smf involved in DNA uptake
LTNEQDKLYSLLPEPEEGAVELDILIRKSGASAGSAQALLTELELFGLIEKVKGGKWRKKPIAQ